MFSHLTTFIQLALVFGGVMASQFVLPTMTTSTVQLDGATVLGITNNSVTSYLGIPFAEPPVGDLRLRHPKLVSHYNGTIDATRPATQCIQLSPFPRSDLPSNMLQAMEEYFSSVIVFPAPQGEDCLTMSINVPEGTRPGAKLPVVASIYGGGFTVGSTAQMPGDAFVQRSAEIDQPVIFVGMNYRLNAFGFLGGKEVKDAGVGNLGLHDQRGGLKWIKNHIAAFGGDPDRVTLWGPSAGAISTALHMITNDANTEDLFHGAVMSAGFPIPTSDITNLQGCYDAIVVYAGCADSSDTLECLRHVSADELLAAAATLPNLFDYTGVNTPWEPHADGVFLKAPPQHLVLTGRVANIPFITGDALDEGTVFATGSFNVTTEEEFQNYIKQLWYPRAPKAALSPLFKLYPNDPAQGSPFGTGDANQLAPQYKRMSAFQGDVFFHGPRQFFHDQRSSKQPTWSYISQRKAQDGLGFAHDDDFFPALFEKTELTDYIIQFAATGDPNGASNRTIPWPRYDTESRKTLMIFDDGIAIGNDTLRLEPIARLTALSIAYPL